MQSAKMYERYIYYHGKRRAQLGSEQAHGAHEGLKYSSYGMCMVNYHEKALGTANTTQRS